MTGLEPRGFVWVITGKLAISERIGGYGFQHRRVRRQEEITWVKNVGVTAVLSLLPGPQNLASYEEDDLATYSVPLIGDFEDEDVERVFTVIDEVLADPNAVLLVHRDTVDDVVEGLQRHRVAATKVLRKKDLAHPALTDETFQAVAVV